MKKSFIFAALAFIACAVFAFNVSQFAPKDGAAYTLGSVGGKLVAVEAFSPGNGGVTLKRVWSSDVYTNAVQLVPSTSTVYTVTYSNAYTHVVSTNQYNTLSWIYDPYIIAQTTNTTVTVATNTWPVFKNTVAITNTLVTGTAVSNVYTGAPSATTYLAPGEKLLVEGATNGFFRLVFE
jgi:hypothetical protein